MILKEKERSVIEDLQTQEKSCVEKYGKYAEQARDPEQSKWYRHKRTRLRRLPGYCCCNKPQLQSGLPEHTDKHSSGKSVKFLPVC